MVLPNTANPPEGKGGLRTSGPTEAGTGYGYLTILLGSTLNKPISKVVMTTKRNKVTGKFRTSRDRRIVRVSSLPPSRRHTAKG